jgi:hypothetical protein
MLGARITDGARTTRRVVPATLSHAPRRNTLFTTRDLGRLVVESRVARGIAHRAHMGQLTRFGEPVISHVQRVADRVPLQAQNTALLHELFERTPVDGGELRARGLTSVELAALELLTRDATGPYRTHIRRIADAPGEHGRIARMVKLADLEDHLSHPLLPSGAPPYAWARRCVLEHSEVDVWAELRGSGRAVVGPG